jgi:hypothetical protein
MNIVPRMNHTKIVINTARRIIEDLLIWWPVGARFCTSAA